MHLLVLHSIMNYQCMVMNHLKLPLHCNRDRQMQFTGKSSPITGREWPRGFQEVKVPGFHDDTGWW